MPWVQAKDDIKIIDFGLARELGEAESIEMSRLQVIILILILILILITVSPKWDSNGHC